MGVPVVEGVEIALTMAQCPKKINRAEPFFPLKTSISFNYKTPTSSQVFFPSTRNNKSKNKVLQARLFKSCKQLI